MTGSADPTGAAHASADYCVDYDGFIGLVAPDDYDGYIGDWTLETLRAKFIEQMNEERLFVAYAGHDNESSPIHIETAQSLGTAVRSAASVLKVGTHGLWLTSYADLTMAAQFPEPLSTAVGARLPVSPGRYTVTLRELMDAPARFVLTIAPAIAVEVLANTAVPWWDADR